MLKTDNFLITLQKISWIYLDIAALQHFKLYILLHRAYGDHAINGAQHAIVNKHFSKISLFIPLAKSQKNSNCHRRVTIHLEGSIDFPVSFS